MAKKFVKKAKRMRFKVVLVSNVVIKQRAERVERIAKSLHVECVCAHWPKLKPRRNPYLEALALVDAQPHEAAMIGDQMFTDILGAIRAGIKAVFWVYCVGNDHPTTWFLRWLEQLVTARRKHGGQ